MITQKRLPQPPGQTQPGALVKGPHWQDAKRINSMVLALEPYLLNATTTGVFQIRDTSNLTDVASALSGASVFSNVTGEGMAQKDYFGKAGHFLLGEFRLQDGRTAVMVHNQLPHVTSWPTLTRKQRGAGAPQLQEVDMVGGGIAPLLDDSPLVPGLQLRFGEGMARFIVVGAKR